MSFYLRTLGQLTLHPEGPDSESVLSESKSLVILALLAAAPDHTMARDHLSELLWPGTDHRKARRSLRQSLYYLTQQAGAELIESENAHVRLRAESFDCDLWELDRAIRASDHTAVADSVVGRFLQSLERKLGRELSEWADLQNERLRSARRDAYGRLIEQSLTKGDREEAARFARDYAARNPLDEEAQLQLIRTLKHVRDEAGAFRAYEEYRSLIRAALEDEPSDEMKKAVDTVRQVLLADREWKPIAADPGPEALSVTTAKRWAVWLVVAGAAVGVGATSVVLALTGEPPPPPNTTLDNLSARIVVGVVGEPEFRDLVLEGDEARLEATRTPFYRNGPGIVSPNGERAAYRVSTPDGIDAYLGEGDAEPQRLFFGPGDQEAVDWSPDGQQLLLVLGEIDSTGAYVESVLTYDIARGHLGPTLARYRNALEPLVRWSPDGTRLAVAEDGGGQYDLRVITVDGSREWLIAETDANELHAAWSPDGRRLASTSDASGAPKVFLYSFDEDMAQQLTDGVEAEATPTWLSDNVVLFTREGTGGHDAWALDTETGESRQVTHCACLAQLAWPKGASLGARSEWIDQVTVEAPPAAVPGDTLAIPAALLWNGGRTQDVGEHELASWRSTDSTIAKPLPDGRIAILSPGDVSLVLTVGGWRADTVQLRAGALVRRDPPAPFTETWTDGIGTAWLPMGEPRPYSRPDGGPDGNGVFVNNGDLHWQSGVVSRRSFDTRQGITVEAWGLLATSGEAHQTWGFGLTADTLSPLTGNPLPERSLQLAIFGQRDEIEIQYGGPRISTSRREAPETWHRYTLQLDPNGTLSLFVDGELVVRRLEHIDPGRIPERVHLALGWRSRDAEVLHGTTRVWEDLLYEP